MMKVVTFSLLIFVLAKEGTSCLNSHGKGPWTNYAKIIDITELNKGQSSGLGCPSYNTDLPGNDYTVFEDVEDWEACGLRCEETNQCAFWSYIESDYVGVATPRQCYMKTKNGGQSTVNGVTSGGKNCKAPPSGLLCPVYNTDLHGNDIEMIEDVENWGACGTRCDATPGCYFWSYLNADFADAARHGQCYLKSKNGGQSALNGVISGGKDCRKLTDCRDDPKYAEICWLARKDGQCSEDIRKDTCRKTCGCCEGGDAYYSGGDLCHESYTDHECWPRAGVKPKLC